jgi:hypothetical protein
MYYSQPSPGIAHKLPDQSSWPRTHHPVLGPPGPNANIGIPPQSPGYPLFTNGNVNHLHNIPTPHPHIPIQAHHHHQNSLSHMPSPPHQQNQHPMGPQNDSPGSITGAQPIMTQHWQNQLLKCEVCDQDYIYSYQIPMHHSVPVDDSSISFSAPPCSRKCHGFTDDSKICDSDHKPQPSQT